MLRTVFVAYWLLPVVAYAQALPDIVTDRPDFTESGVTVPRGHVQIESGLTWETVADENATTLPELLVRWAPLPRVELRFGVPDYVAGEFSNGLADGSLGLKVQLGPLADWDLGFIASVTLPVGQREYSSDSVDPEFIAIVGRDLSSRVSLGAQGMLAFDGTEDVWQFGGTLVAGIDLGRRVGTFIELLATDQRGSDAQIILHHGYTYLVSPTVQLDAHGGLGILESGGGQALVGAGLSVLF